ncbi:hypothetical protein AL060_19825 [Pseudomonas syringae pv. rhaphiolepidis]|nr:hypothetical protein AL060_19825 [Pseudomonas syringae pv. rhaphiolepidis]
MTFKRPDAFWFNTLFFSRLDSLEGLFNLLSKNRVDKGSANSLLFSQSPLLAACKLSPLKTYRSHAATC